MPHTHQQHTSIGIFQADMTSRTSMLPHLRYKFWLLRLQLRNNSQNLQDILIMLCFSVIHTVFDCSTKSMHVAVTLLSHISDYLQLCWRATLQDFGTEANLELSLKLSCHDERIWSKTALLIPLIYQSFEAEITEHTHITPFNSTFYKRKDLFFSLGELLVGVALTAFPIEHHTIRFNFLQGGR